MRRIFSLGIENVVTICRDRISGFINVEVADLLLQIRISNRHRKVIPFVFILGRLAGNKKLYHLCVDLALIESLQLNASNTKKRKKKHPDSPLQHMYVRFSTQEQKPC